ncbi:unnamed protein product [Cyclocybe aegerita]|uniref:NB-ARC domain-containing protein n=1 Tax=Cyclocybe aegerita TaxID=1973307 RepID=A0A8S0XQ66_CYCAE|nr:unnamed protein product [Cyclocybe aegerita]
MRVASLCRASSSSFANLDLPETNLVLEASEFANDATCDLSPNCCIQEPQTRKDPLRSESDGIQLVPALEAAPSNPEYLAETAEKIVTVLQSAADFAPVPFVGLALSVGLKVVQACREMNIVQQQVKELQNRVCALIVAIGNSLTGPEAQENLKVAQGMQNDIEELHKNLQTIVDGLDEIKKKNRWLLIFYKRLNKEKVNGCISTLSIALEKFQLSNDLNTANGLGQLQSRLDQIAIMTGAVSDQVGKMDKKMDTNFNALMDAIRNSKDNTIREAMTRQQMPPNRQTLRGREDLVIEISKLLVGASTTSRVCVLGPGGMGKTALAVSVANSSLVQAKFSDLNRCWVPCIEASSTKLFLQLLYTSLRITADTKNPLDDILFELKRSITPRLILMDNFETTWNAPGCQKDVGDILRHLVDIPHVAILMTMRGLNPPADDIPWQKQMLEPINEASCRQLYHGVCPSTPLDDPHLAELLKALGYMPFAVKLMARLGKETESTVHQLLEDWEKLGTEMLSSDEESMDRTIDLSVDSQLMKNDPNALTLLAVLSMLPAGSTREHLEWCVPGGCTTTAIATLARAALAFRRQDNSSPNTPLYLFVPPVVQSYMRSKKRIPDTVGQHADVAELAKEDTNIQAVLFAWKVYEEDDSSGGVRRLSFSNELLRALVAFTWYSHDTNPCLDLAEHTLKVAQAARDSRYEAEANFCLGAMYAKLGLAESAREPLTKAREGLKALKTDLQARKRAAECGLYMAKIPMTDPAERLKYLQDIRREFASLSDVCGQVRCIVQMGRNSPQENALRVLQEGITLLENTEHRLDLARCLLAMTDVCHQMKDYTKAEWFIRRALAVAEPVKEAYLYMDLVESLATVLIEIPGRQVEALEQAMKALLLHQQNGRPVGIAENFELIGYIYIRLDNRFPDALQAYERAHEAYTRLGSLPAGKKGAPRCQSNIESLNRKIKTPSETIRLLKPGDLEEFV